MRVAHVITGLGTGGAETMLLKLLMQLRESDVSSDVLSLTDRGDMADRLEDAGARVFATGLSRSMLRFPFAVVEVSRLLRSLRPDVVQTWMYHADLIGGLAARLSGVQPLLWNVRQSNLGRDVNRRSTMLAMWTCARLSANLPVKIVSNSSAAVRSHQALGYDPSRFVVIPNGFDVDRFRPDPEARSSVREELGIGGGDIVLGYVARWDRQKSPESLILAAGRAMDIRPDVSAILCGTGLGRENQRLRSLVAETGHEERFRLLGRRHDVARITASFDIGVSSSVGEGFSNAIGEAMACGVPCVVTDVGDSAAVAGSSGVVVPSGDAERLAEGILSLVRSDELRARLGVLARERIVREFSIGAVARRYVDVWRESLTCAA